MNSWVSSMSRLNWMASQLSTFEGTEYAARRVADLADQFERDIQTRMMMTSLPSALPTSPMQSPPMGYLFDNYTPDNRYPIEPAPSGSGKSKGKQRATGI